ncbi:hypothetical protein BH20ACI4_BH20ACI4_12210 [soil metagenome]
MNKENFTVGQTEPVEVYREGWELIKNDYRLMFAIALVGGLIGRFSLYILPGVWCAKFLSVFCRKIDTGTRAFLVI